MQCVPIIIIIIIIIIVRFECDTRTTQAYDILDDCHTLSASIAESVM